MAQWVKNPTAAVWIAAVAHIKSLAWELPYAVDVFIIFFFFFLCFFRATPAVYGSSQARG